MKKTLLLVSLAAAFWPAYAWAVDPPPGTSAATQEARFREENLEKRADRLGEKKAGPTPIEDRVEPKAAQLGGATMKVPVREIHFIGNYSIPESELRPLVQELIGRDAALDEIQTAVSRVKKHYREKGYIATYAYVPPQEVQNGVVSIDVIEGRLGELRVEGGKFYSPEWLRKQFSAKSGEVLTYDLIRKDLNRLNRREDLKAKLALEAGKQIGTADAVVTVEDQYPIHLSTSLNNSGTKSTGLYSWGVAARNNNLTGRGDVLSLTTQLSSGVGALGAGYDAPLPAFDGQTRAGYQFSYADVDIGGAFRALRAEGKAATHSFYLTRPLRETASTTIDGTIGFDMKEVRNKLLGQSSGKDDLRILRVESSLEHEGEGHKSAASGGVYVGIPDIFGGMDDEDPEATRAGTGGEFFAARGQAAHFRRLGEALLLAVRASAQATSDNLPSSEQFRLGGARSVRGYGESEALADYGAQVSAEIFMPLNFIPADWHIPTGESMREAIQAFVFADAGYGALRSPAPGENKHKALAGAGAGVRIKLGRQFFARLEYGFPLGDEPADNRDHAFYFTLGYEFF